MQQIYNVTKFNVKGLTGMASIQPEDPAPPVVDLNDKYLKVMAERFKHDTGIVLPLWLVGYIDAVNRGEKNEPE